MIDVIERLQKAETRPLDADGKTQLWETLQDARAEIARLRLTDAEREAVEATIVDLDGGANFNEQRFWPMLAKRLRERSATLRGLLERTGGGK